MRRWCCWLTLAAWVCVACWATAATSSAGAADGCYNKAILEVSPTTGPDETRMRLTGCVPCSYGFIGFFYEDYSGQRTFEQWSVGPLKREPSGFGYHFETTRLVPTNARPGPAQVFSDGSPCGNPDDEASEVVDYTITKGTTVVGANPLGASPGQSIKASVARCYGSVDATADLKLEFSGGTLPIRLHKIAHRPAFSGSFTIPSGARPGSATLAVTRLHCPGSVIGPGATLTILGSAKSTTTSFAPPETTDDTRTISTPTSATDAAITTRTSQPQAASAKRDRQARDDTVGPWFLVGGALATLAGFGVWRTFLRRGAG